MVIIQLTDEEIALVLRLADASYEEGIRKYGEGWYGDNHLKRHQIGKLGEMAVARHLENGGVKCDRAFVDIGRDGETDVLTNGARIEVKTWAGYSWPGGGRCVKPKQMSYILAKADVIVWCKLSGTVNDGQVEIRGWFTPQEVAVKPVIETTVGSSKGENHQVPEDELHPAESLSDRVRS